MSYCHFAQIAASLVTNGNHSVSSSVTSLNFWFFVLFCFLFLFFLFILQFTQEWKLLVLLLTKNWAMSKAKSWTKLNRCSASGATQPRHGFRSSGLSGTPRLTEHKVTNTTSQQSWAMRWYKGQKKIEKKLKTTGYRVVLKPFHNTMINK